MKFQDMPKEIRDRMVLKGLLLAGGILALFLLGIRPLLQKNRTLEMEIEEVNRRIQTANRLLRRDTPLREEAAALQEELKKRMEKHLPPVENPLLWATQIVYRHAAARGIEVRAISEDSFSLPFWIRSARPPGQDGARSSSRDEASAAWRSFSPYVVQVNVEAPFPDILLLIADLEREHPLLNVSAVSLQSDARSPVILRARLSLQWPRLAVSLDPRLQAFLDSDPATEEVP